MPSSLFWPCNCPLSRFFLCIVAQNCHEHCSKDAEATFFGLQYGDECWCGKSSDVYGKSSYLKKQQGRTHACTLVGCDRHRKLNFALIFQPASDASIVRRVLMYYFTIYASYHKVEASIRSRWNSVFAHIYHCTHEHSYEEVFIVHLIGHLSYRLSLSCFRRAFGFMCFFPGRLFLVFFFGLSCCAFLSLC